MDTGPFFCFAGASDDLLRMRNSASNNHTLRKIDGARMQSCAPLRAKPGNPTVQVLTIFWKTIAGLTHTGRTPRHGEAGCCPSEKRWRAAKQ